jgi:hypothetical protein
LLAKTADGDIEKIGVEDELFLHSAGANVMVSGLWFKGRYALIIIRGFR